ncbi:ArdC family protein [uncultured Helicobacter sp.]|uniref:ArdC family protein n=1 Tax=uncultured Helicobacter sp. TaxID=175537 RepID=UPI00374E9568
MNRDKIEQLADKMAQRIFEAIQQGTAPWLKPWSNDGILPHNPLTGTIYKGANALRLLLDHHSDNRYLTFKQIKDLGGYVKKGEKGTEILYTAYQEEKLIDTELETPTTQEEQRKEKQNTQDNQEAENTKDTSITMPKKFFHKLFYVFNINQCENIDMEKIKEYQKQHNITPIEEIIKNRDKSQENPMIEQILKNSNIPIIHHAKDMAYYSPREDKIYLPPKESFYNQEQYYSTALHELGHATGHNSRLNRNISEAFGSSSYAKEELRAELYSFLQSLELGIDHNLKNHASYVDSWSKGRFEDSKEEIKKAIKDSVKMVKYVRGNWYPHELKQKLINSYKQENTPTKDQPQRQYKPQAKKSRGRR